MFIVIANEPKKAITVAEAVAERYPTVTIIDVREVGDCKYQTLMKSDGDFRFTRCGYFGERGDKFKWGEKE